MPYGDCPDCKECRYKNSFACEDCIDGRFVEEVFTYASTCDGCGELTLHELLTMDEKTQLSYCEQCEKMKESVTSTSTTSNSKVPKIILEDLSRTFSELKKEIALGKEELKPSFIPCYGLGDWHLKPSFNPWNFLPRLLLSIDEEPKRIRIWYKISWNFFTGLNIRIIKRELEH